MNKILLFIIIFVNFSFFSSQSNFEYQRNWSTYLGPVGSAPWPSRGMGGNRSIVFDKNSNIYLNGSVHATNNYTASYYNQYVVGPLQSGIWLVPNSQTSNEVSAKLSSSGVVNYYQYCYQWNNQSTYSKYVLNVDSNGNQYCLFFYSASNMNPAVPLPTSGTWMTSSSNNTGSILAKYSESGALLWSTYVPTVLGLQIDSSNNIYISGSNTNQQNFTTPGVFQENFQNTSSNYNGYIAKLNSQGQRVWVTYHPGYAKLMRVHADGIYITVETIPNNNQIVIPTTGAFQTAESKMAIMKLNAANGTRNWGTFYGPTSNIWNINGLEVNERGLYLMGSENQNVSYYFATAGAFKSQITGGSDYFLSRFDLNGNRLWSTYFGSTGSETMMSVTPMAVSGNEIYVGGTVSGVGSNIATSGTYQTSPEQNTSDSHNLFFSKFHSNGSLVWTSYYGGTTNVQIPYLNVAINGNSLYLYGSTNSSSGYTTSGAWQNQILNPNPTTAYSNPVNFLARFDNNSLSVSEQNKSPQDLVLYDNPNDGNFSISGGILEKQNCTLKIFDFSSRKLMSYKMGNAKNQRFNLKNKLVKGNYIVAVNDSKNRKIKTFNMIVK